MGLAKSRFKVTTWNNKHTMLPKGRATLHHLIGSYYTARIGYGSLLNLDYCIYFERIGYRGTSGCRMTYDLLKKPYANNAVRNKTHCMKRGILEVLTRKMSLRVLLRQLPKTGAINLPPYRYDYKLVAVCLVGANGKIIDIDARCHHE